MAAVLRPPQFARLPHLVFDEQQLPTLVVLGEHMTGTMCAGLSCRDQAPPAQTEGNSTLPHACAGLLHLVQSLETCL